MIRAQRGSKKMVIELEEKFKLRKAEIFATIKKYVTEAKLDISDTVVENLSIHLALSITRELSGSYIEMSSSQIEQLKQANTYQISQLIVYDLSKKYDVRISEDDICYCAMYLSNMTLLDLDFFSECDIIDQETESITLEAVQEINNRLGLNLKKNDDFYQGLSMHFYPAIQRLKNDEQLHDNVLTDKIKTENETEYKCAMILNDVVKEHYHKSFNEDELAYIALHFGTALR